MSTHRIRADWLAAAEETPLLPELPIIDPHLHLLHRCPLPLFTPPERPYEVAEAMAQLACGHHVVATVHVQFEQCYRPAGPEHLRPVGETEWVAGLTENLPRGAPRLAAGIVGWADLTRGAAVEEVLRAHIAAGRCRFRGIRMMAHSDPHGTPAGLYPPRPGLLRDAQFRAGFAALARLGLRYDAFQYRFQLADIADLARQFPDTPIIVNHLSSPVFTGPYAGRRAEVFAAWRAGIQLLAPLPNVFMKLGGMGADRFGFDLAARATPAGAAELAALFRPFVEVCIDALGTGRCMFESNFPVDNVFYAYGVIWNAYKRLAAGASADERADLFHRTAARAYQLDLPDSAAIA